MIIKSALVGLVATLCGCATIISGRTQKVSINTVPPGASVKIDGSDRGTTPLVIILPRRPSHTLALQKDGYSPQNYVINSGFNGWFLGNILLGGVIGMIVDGSTGASSKLEVPNDGNYVLAPVQPPPVSRNH